MNVHTPRWHFLEILGGGDDSFGPFLVKKAFRAHTADDAGAAYRDVAVLVGQQVGRADALIASPGRVGAPDSGQYRNPQFFQFGVPEEGRPAAAPVRVDFLLLGQLDAAAVDYPNDRNV